VFSTVTDKLTQIIRIIISTDIDSILLTKPWQYFITPLVILDPNELIIYFRISIFTSPFINEMETESDHDFGMDW